MKKLLFLIAVAFLGIQARAAMIITNNSNCTLQLRVFAHDANQPASCGLRSNIITLAPGAFVIYSNVSNVNTPAGPGWVGGVTATTTGGTAAWGWDAVEYYGASTAMLIGNPGSCAPTTDANVFSPCATDIAGSFYVVGSNTVADFF